MKVQTLIDNLIKLQHGDLDMELVVPAMVDSHHGYVDAYQPIDDDPNFIDDLLDLRTLTNVLGHSQQVVCLSYLAEYNAYDSSEYANDYTNTIVPMAIENYLKNTPKGKEDTKSLSSELPDIHEDFGALDGLEDLRFSLVDLSAYPREVESMGIAKSLSPEFSQYILDNPHLSKELAKMSRSAIDKVNQAFLYNCYDDTMVNHKLTLEDITILAHANRIKNRG